MPADVSAVAGVPAELAPLFTAAGKTCPQVSPALLAAQAKHESMGFNRDVIAGRRLSPVGAMGLAQFMPATWKTWGAGGSPFRPADAIPAQARYMCALAKDPRIANARGDVVSRMLAAYNAGPAAVQRYNGVPPYRETRKYVALIRSELD